MKKTKIIGILVIILIICLFIVLTFLASITMLDEKNDTVTAKGNQNTENVDIFETNNVIEENINNNVKTFPFEIQGMTSDILKYVNDIEGLNTAVKEYIYKYGLFDVTVAEVQKYEYQESTKRLGIIFKLNNPNKDRLRVIINDNGKIDISNYE